MKSDFLQSLEPGEMSHPSRGAWIEIGLMVNLNNMIESHPSRGAWIEIAAVSLVWSCFRVAPLTGCVD